MQEQMNNPTDTCCAIHGAACTEACDVHGGNTSTHLHRCKRCSNFAFLTGYALRSDEEQAEVESTAAWLVAQGADPRWEIVPREELQPIEGEMLGAFRARYGLPGATTSAARALTRRNGRWEK